MATTTTKNIALSASERRYIIATSAFEHYPCLESLEALEQAAEELTRFRNKAGIPIDEVLADVNLRARQRRHRQVSYTEDPQGRTMEERELFVAVSIWFLGIVLFCASCYGLFKLFNLFME